jgi:hypothetical protein
MVIKSSTTATDAQTTASQIIGELTTGVTSADSTAAERVQNLQRVHQARVSQLSRTVASLKAQYGADDPKVKTAEAAVAAANVTAARVSMAHQQLTTVEPQVAEHGWALHGRVFDAQLHPVSGFTLFLVDAKRTYQQAYGFAYTDDTGYFLLNYTGPDSTSTEKSQPATQAEAAPQLFIEIADTRALPVYLSPTAFHPVVGTATYQNIMLPDGDQAIGDPPPEIRGIAMPPRKKGKKA